MKLKNTFSLLILVALSLVAKSQGLTEPESWTSYYSTSQLLVEYKYTNCSLAQEAVHERNIYLRFTNLSSKALEIKYEQELHYGTQCLNCAGGDPERTKHIQLAPDQQLEGTCALSTGKDLKIFVRDLSDEMASRFLSEFKLKEFQITSH